MTADQIRERLSHLPRVSLACLPTPLHLCPRLSEWLGVELYVKRDDLTGLAFGGNKVRQHEFILAEAVRAGATVVLAGAGSQSNYCRQLAAGCARLGLRADLTLMHGVKGARAQGNLLLDHLLGAEVRVVEADWDELAELFEQRAEEYRRQGEVPFVVSPFGATNRLGAAAYVDAFLECEQQLEALGVRPSALVVSAADMTPAGLALAARLRQSPIAVQGFSPVPWREPRPPAIARLATETAALLGCGVVLSADEIRNDDGYIGAGYGLVSDSVLDLVRTVARREGLLLDPVYTGKAFAGMVDYLRTGRLPTDQPLVFWHTGGLPALFAYDDEVLGR